jgi:hypothetical protein
MQSVRDLDKLDHARAIFIGLTKAAGLLKSIDRDETKNGGKQP